MPENIDGQMQGPSHVSLTAEVQSSTSKNGCDDQKHSVPFLPLLEHSGNDGSCMMLPTEINNGKDAGVGTPMPSAAPSSEYEVMAIDSTAGEISFNITSCFILWKNDNTHISFAAA